jgi:uncharacterized protein with PIN domain
MEPMTSVCCEDCGNARRQPTEGVSAIVDGVDHYICPACATKYWSEHAIMERFRDGPNKRKRHAEGR